MGLDVYVYRCPDRESARFNEKEYEKATERIGATLRTKLFGSSDWKSIPEGRWDEYWNLHKQECEPFRQRFGMKEDGYSHSTDEKIEQPSSKHPEHYFKIGYFRSSYNDGGFNAYARRLGVPDLNAIFANEDSEYEFVPDWAAARDRAAEALSLLRQKDFGFDVFDVAPNLFAGPPTIMSEKQALDLFKKQFDEWQVQPDGFDSYSNSEGHYMRKGCTIHAALPGMKDFIGRPTPCTYLVVKRDEENWYAQALEVVIETCNYVLEQPDYANYYLHWSG